MVPGSEQTSSLPGAAAIAPGETGATGLERSIASQVAAHPGRSGIVALPDGLDAFAARMHLARSAERSLDVQYYIWADDLTGTLLFEALHAAAERGVKVRLLLDDNNTSRRLDAMLAALDAHRNVEVRLFNPFRLRRHRWLDFLFDFARLHRRMHNKSFTADRVATIVGGRNVGDEYFGAAEERLFVDVDVLAIGPVVTAVADDFERYWACAWARPATQVLEPVPTSHLLAVLDEAATRRRSEPLAVAYAAGLSASTIVAELVSGRLEFDWAVADLVSDPPSKVVDRAESTALLPASLRVALGDPEHTLDLVSAYFVPTRTGVDALIALAGRGTRVRILTNSLEATDVTVVHAGYAGRRRPLLEAGIELFELQRLSAQRRRRRGKGRFGRSATSLHAKTIAVDGARTFVGSFNFDPRSARLNTEMGLVIHSARLATQVTQAFDEGVLAHAYQVRLADRGRLAWYERRLAGPIRHDVEPGTGVGRRTLVRVLSWLPIEWLL